MEGYFIPRFLKPDHICNAFSVYTLNSAHIDDDEGARLENFFWRIWSNPRIVKSIRGNTLARLFITISEGGNRVRTTPVPTPLASTPTQSAVCLRVDGPKSLSTNRHRHIPRPPSHQRESRMRQQRGTTNLWQMLVPSVQKHLLERSLINRGLFHQSSRNPGLGWLSRPSPQRLCRLMLKDAKQFRKLDEAAHRKA